MDLLYVVLRTLLICTIGLLIAFQGRRMGLSIFNLTGRLNRLQFIICFIALMILFHIVHYIDNMFLDFVVSLPAYWLTRVIVWLLLATLFPLSCVLFGRRIHDIGFNAWAGILWSVIMIFINTYSAVSPFNYMLELFIWLIGFLFWVLPGQPEPNQYGNPPFMPVKSANI